MITIKTRYVLFLLAFAFASVTSTSRNASGAQPPEAKCDGGKEAVQTQTSGREIASAQSNPYYGAVLSLRWGPGPCCDSFSLLVANNTEKPLEILWSKTFYVHNGTRNGGFLFGQSACSDADLPETSTIPPGGSYETTVWPESLIHSHSSPQTCAHSFLQTGKDGIFLTIRGDGVEMSETVDLNLDFEHLFPPAG